MLTVEVPFKALASGKLTGCEDGFTQLLSASMQLWFFYFFDALHKPCLGAKSKYPPA